MPPWTTSAGRARCASTSDDGSAVGAEAGGGRRSESRLLRHAAVVIREVRPSTPRHGRRSRRDTRAASSPRPHRSACRRHRTRRRRARPSAARRSTSSVPRVRSTGSQASCARMVPKPPGEAPITATCARRRPRRIGRRARQPVDRVLEHAGDRIVVFGRDHQQRVGGGDALSFSAATAAGRPGGFEVAVVERDAVQRLDGEFCPRRHHPRRRAQQRGVERGAARRLPDRPMIFMRRVPSGSMVDRGLQRWCRRGPSSPLFWWPGNGRRRSLACDSRASSRPIIPTRADGAGRIVPARAVSSSRARRRDSRAAIPGSASRVRSGAAPAGRGRRRADRQHRRA